MTMAPWALPPSTAPRRAVSSCSRPTVPPPPSCTAHRAQRTAHHTQRTAHRAPRACHRPAPPVASRAPLRELSTPPRASCHFPAPPCRLLHAGYNAIRTSHNPVSPAFLAACDRVGMLVMDEAFDCWSRGQIPEPDPNPNPNRNPNPNPNPNPNANPNPNPDPNPNPSPSPSPRPSPSPSPDPDPNQARPRARAGDGNAPSRIPQQEARGGEDGLRAGGVPAGPRQLGPAN